MASFGREQEITAKPDGSFVTATDRAIEELTRGRIADQFPGHGAHGEEFGRLSDLYDTAVAAANNAYRELHEQAAGTGSAAA